VGSLLRNSAKQQQRAVYTSFVTEYTGCPRRNVPYFGRVFLMLKYTDITQNTYVQTSGTSGSAYRKK
jgi:hypothetical protein